MRVDCTICEPWWEERHFQEGHYFQGQDPILTSSDYGTEQATEN